MAFICSLVLLLALSVVSDSSQAGVLNWLDDGLKVIKRSSDGMARAVSMSVPEELIEKAVAKYGDDAAMFLEKTGAKGSAALDRYGKDVLAWYRVGGENALRVIERPRFAEEVLPILRRYGPDVIEVESKAPGLAGNLFRTYGNDAARYARRLSSENVVRMAGMGPRLEAMGKAQRFGELAWRFGDSLFDIIEKALALMNRHPKAAAMSLTFLYCLSHPDTMTEFLKALADIPGKVARELGRALVDPPGRFPIKTAVLGLAMGLPFLLSVYLRHRRKVYCIRAEANVQG